MYRDANSKNPDNNIAYAMYSSSILLQSIAMTEVMRCRIIKTFYLIIQLQMLMSVDIYVIFVELMLEEETIPSSVVVYEKKAQYLTITITSINNNITFRQLHRVVSKT